MTNPVYDKTSTDIHHDNKDEAPKMFFAEDFKKDANVDDKEEEPKKREIWL